MENDSEAVCMHQDIPPTHTWRFFLFFPLSFFYWFIEFKTLIILEISPEHFERHREFRATRKSGILSPFIFFFIKFSLNKSSSSIRDGSVFYVFDVEIFFIPYFYNRTRCKYTCLWIHLPESIFSAILAYANLSHLFNEMIFILILISAEEIELIYSNSLSTSWNSINF